MESTTPLRSPMASATHALANQSSPLRPLTMSSPVKMESKIPFPASKLPRPNPSPIKPALKDLTEENLLDIEPVSTKASPARVAPVKAFKPTSRPPTSTVAIPSTTSLNLRKRKEPDSGPSVVKRTAPVLGSASAAKPSGSRSVSASAATTTRAALGRPAAPTKPPAPTSRSRLAASTSAVASTTSRARPGSSINQRPIAGTTRTTRSALGASTSGASSTLGRSVSAGTSRIGSGVASTAALQSQGGRVTEVEKAITSLTAMMQLEQERRVAIEQGQQAMQQQLLTSQNEEREARRNLSSAGEEIAALKSKHRDEVDELERQVTKKERERRDLEMELGDVRADLDLTRAEVRELKVRSAAPETVWPRR